MACCAECEASGEGMGDILPTFTWPSDVDRRKVEVGAAWESTNLAVLACPGLAPGLRQGWDNDLAAWRAFAVESTPLFGSANQFDLTLSYQAKLAAWQDTLTHASCALASPPVEQPREWTSGADSASLLKTLVIGAAIVAGVVLVAPVVWEAVATHKALR